MKLPEPREILPPPTLEDSPDFTRPEAEGAEPLRDEKHFAERLGHLCCGTCEGQVAATGLALKRFGGEHYSRVKLTCVNGHSATQVFKLWLK